MIEIKITVEELLNIIEGSKTPIKIQLEKILQMQVDSFCEKQTMIQRYKRNWSLSLQDIKDENDKPIENAYAIYTDEADKIILTNELYKQLFLFMKECEFQYEHALWMTFLALVFCVSHEMSHLYAGHCQLSKKNKLGILYNQETGLSYLEHQALEIEADHIAAGRAAEIVASVFMNGDYKRIYKYKNKEMFYSDSVKAICRFFYYVRHIGKEEKMYKMEIDHITHPPAFFRCFMSVLSFVEHYKLYFEDKSELFFDSFFYDLTDKKTFGETFLEDNKYGKLDFKMINEYTGMLHKIFDMSIKNKIEKLRRISFVHEYLNIQNLMLDDYRKKYSDNHLFS